MQHFTVIKVLAAVAAFATLGSSEIILNGTLKWTGPSKGKNVTLYGDATQVMAQLKALDPQWVGKVASPVAVQNGTYYSGAKLNITGVSSELSDARAGLICCPVSGQNFVREAVGDIQYIASKLGTTNGIFYLSPKSCVQMIQFDGAAIVVCNDNAYEHALYGDTIGSYAASITTACPLDQYQRTCGQFFDTDGFNVIITKRNAYGPYP